MKDEGLFNYILAFLNTKVAYEYLAAFNPTINLLTTDICNIPMIIDTERQRRVKAMVDDNLATTKDDWDAFETSWDFKKHPLI